MINIYLFHYLILDSGQAVRSKSNTYMELHPSLASAQEARGHCLSFLTDAAWSLIIWLRSESAQIWLFPLFFWNWKQHGSGTLILCDQPLPSIISAGDLALMASAWPSYYTACYRIVTSCHSLELTLFSKEMFFSPSAFGDSFCYEMHCNAFSSVVFSISNCPSNSVLLTCLNGFWIIFLFLQQHVSGSPGTFSALN